MEKKLMMPANYNVMTEEEMTYTEGGGLGDTAIRLAEAGFGIWGLYNYYKGMVATRAYVKAHKKQDAAQLIEGGLNTYVNYMQKDLLSAFKGVCAGLAATGLFPITALCILTA